MKNKSISLFKAFFLSSFSIKFYKNVMQDWRWNTLTYVSIVVAIFWALCTCRLLLGSIQFGDHLVQKIAIQMPTVHIKNGTAFSNAKKTSDITLKGSQQPFIKINVDHNTNTINDSRTMISVQKNQILYRSKGAVSAFVYPKNLDIILSKKMLLHYYHQFKFKIYAALSFFMYVMGYLMALVFYSIFVGIWYVIGVIGINHLHSKISSLSLLRAVAVSTTWPLMFYGLCIAFRFYSFSITMTMLIFQFIYVICIAFLCQEFFKKEKNK